MSKNWIADLLSKSSRPVIIAGAGCLLYYRELRTFATLCNIPVVNSLPAAGIMPYHHMLFFGMIGHTGLPAANKIVQESDLVIALGARLDVRQTGTETSRFAPHAKIVMVNNDPGEMTYPRVRVDFKHEDCYEFLTNAIAEVSDLPDTNYSSWIAQCDEWATTIMPPVTRMSMAIGEIDDLYYEQDAIFVTGVGSHQQHAARHLSLDYPRRMLITSAGHGTMGAGLPMAIGAAIETGRKVVLIDGDGSFQLSLNELGTVMAYYPELNLDIHIIDNGGGGIVNQFCHLQGYDPRDTTWINPDFAQIGNAYGVKIKVHRVGEDGVWPILEAGHTMDDMTWQKGKL